MKCILYMNRPNGCLTHRKSRDVATRVKKSKNRTLTTPGVYIIIYHTDRSATTIPCTRAM